MKKHFIIALAFAAVGFTACNSNNSSNKTASATDDNATAGAQQTEAAASQNPLSEVYASYFALKNALAGDSGGAAQTAGKNLHEAIANVQTDQLSGGAQDTWAKYQKRLSYDAEHIMGVDHTDHQREHFVSLSNNMYKVMKVIKPEKTVYYQHCPMYDNGKGGNWLSYDSAIYNPYLGASMPDCGKTIETITH